MKARYKIIIIILSFAFISWIIFYFVSPTFLIASSIDIESEDLINKKFSNVAEKFEVKFSSEKELHILRTDGFTQSDFLYTFEIDEGVIKINDDYTFVLMGQEKMIFLQESMLLLEVTI